MISFSSDYIQGAHEAILDAFIRTNMEQLAGYGDDIYCQRAKQKIANHPFHNHSPFNAYPLGFCLP